MEPVLEVMQSGVEVFCESEPAVAWRDVKRKVISSGAKRRLIARYRASAEPDLLDVYWGDDFDTL